MLPMPRHTLKSHVSVFTSRLLVGYGLAGNEGPPLVINRYNYVIEEGSAVLLQSGPDVGPPYLPCVVNSVVRLF